LSAIDRIVHDSAGIQLDSVKLSMGVDLVEWAMETVANNPRLVHCSPVQVASVAADKTMPLTLLHPFDFLSILFFFFFFFFCFFSNKKKSYRLIRPLLTVSQARSINFSRIASSNVGQIGLNRFAMAGAAGRNVSGLEPCS